LNSKTNKAEENLWQGIEAGARTGLKARDYKAGSLAQRIAYSGIDASELAAADRSRPEVKRAWIPGVEIFPRKTHSQRHRGVFGELGRRDEGVLAKIGFWPKQWSAARMFAQSAKGFHVHPPSIPPDTAAEKWLRRLFVRSPDNYSLRRYDEEQWDVMFFLQGTVEMILCDVRAGFSKRIMRFFIEGDNHRSSNNVGVVVPPGVAHAIRIEGAEDVITVYGTSTIFRPEFEGRIASEVETLGLPKDWQEFLGRGD
jgi:dTDP-4-dehydrorhamnose 3,5-epimerase-like enzyme